MMKKTVRRQQGLTLIDVLIVLTVLSIVCGFSAPSMKTMLDKRRLEGIANEVQADLQYARSEAVSRNRTLRIDFSRDEHGSCYVVHSGGCTCHGDGAVSCEMPEAALKTLSIPASSGIALDSNVSSITLDPVHGTVTPTVTLRMATSAGLEVRHIVNFLGRVRSCSPNRTVSGYPAC